MLKLELGPGSFCLKDPVGLIEWRAISSASGAPNAQRRKIESRFWFICVSKRFTSIWTMGIALS